MLVFGSSAIYLKRSNCFVSQYISLKCWKSIVFSVTITAPILFGVFKIVILLLVRTTPPLFWHFNYFLIGVRYLFYWFIVDVDVAYVSPWWKQYFFLICFLWIELSPLIVSSLVWIFDESINEQKKIQISPAAVLYLLNIASFVS